MKSYEKYKESGIVWINEIPLNWELVKFKRFARIRNGKDQKEVSIDDGGYPILGTGGEFGRSSQFIHDKPSVLLGRKGTINKPQYIEEPFWTVDTLFYTDIYSDVTPKYLFYLSQQIPFDLLQESSAVPSMTQEKLNSVYLCKPSLSEQTKIAQYLDHQTYIIDQLIKQKEKQIELLKEYRQAVINEAVTKGLDPNAKMKDSGIEWLGDVPEGWKVLNFRYVIDILTDFTANGSFADLAKNVNYLDSGYSRLIRLTDLREDLNNSGLYVSEDSHNYLSKSSLYGDEVLVANVGAYAGLAWKVPQLSMPATLGPNMFLLKFNKSLNTDFAYYSLISNYLSDQLKNKAVSAAQPKLNKEDVRSCLFLQPPLEEQIKIVTYLDLYKEKYEIVIDQELKLISKLKEYRQSIISEAVTGKIDVREWQVPDNKYKS